MLVRAIDIDEQHSLEIFIECPIKLKYLISLVKNEKLREINRRKTKKKQKWRKSGKTKFPVKKLTVRNIRFCSQRTSQQLLKACLPLLFSPLLLPPPTIPSILPHHSCPIGPSEFSDLFWQLVDRDCSSLSTIQIARSRRNNESSYTCMIIQRAIGGRKHTLVRTRIIECSENNNEICDRFVRAREKEK